MSEPKRYICTRVLGMFEMQEAKNGEWIYHHDYDRLKAEVDDLKLAARLVIKHLDETGEIDCETILNLRASAGIL